MVIGVRLVHIWFLEGTEMEKRGFEGFKGLDIKDF